MGDLHAMPTRVMMTSGPRFLPGTMSGTMVLLQPGSLLISMDQVVTKGHTDVQDLGSYLWQSWCLRAVLL